MVAKIKNRLYIRDTYSLKTICKISPYLRNDLKLHNDVHTYSQNLNTALAYTY